MFTKAIALFEMLSALLTAVIIGGILLNTVRVEGVTASVVFLAPICVLFVILGFVAGWFLWKNRQAGYWFSIVFQLLQIISISSRPITYIYRAGAYITTKFSSGGIDFTTGAGSDLTIYLGYPEAIASVGINLVALFLTGYLLIRLRKAPWRTV